MVNTLSDSYRYAWMGSFYRAWIKPRSMTEDSRRQEFILNVLLTGAVGISTFGFLVAIITQAVAHAPSNNTQPLLLLIFLGFFLGLGAASRRGHHLVSSYILLSLFWLGGTYSLYRWSIDLPSGLLIYALVVVMAGILTGTAGAIGSVIIVALSLVTLGILQSTHQITSDTAWLHQTIQVGDSISFSIFFGVIALVSWLSNREIDKSLRRARTSEAALTRERDQLEIRVAERTRELEVAQAERIVELQRFAEFGRLSANLMHNIINPLTAAALNLEQLEQGPHSRLLEETRRNIGDIEAYVESARRQLLRQSKPHSFRAVDEINRTLEMLSPKLKTIGMTVHTDCDRSIKLFGEPTKFYQLASNLIANAVEAQSGMAVAQLRPVEVRLREHNKMIEFEVRDWGSGIAPDKLERIFHPFYSTKAADGRGIGLGLAIAKQVVEEDFGGTLVATSSADEGTRFVARLKRPRP